MEDLDLYFILLNLLVIQWPALSHSAISSLTLGWNKVKRKHLGKDLSYSVLYIT